MENKCQILACILFGSIQNNVSNRIDNYEYQKKKFKVQCDP